MIILPKLDPLRNQKNIKSIESLTMEEDKLVNYMGFKNKSNRIIKYIITK